MKKTYFLSLFAIVILFGSCFKDQDDTEVQSSTIDIQNFIYRGLNFFYLYKADTPELADDAFADEGELNQFLEGFDTPESLFSFLQSDQDRFSILVEDYIELENSLGGTGITNGMEFGLVFYPNSTTNVFGYVRYVLPNTDAEAKNVTRGMIFNTVDGTQLTNDNFRDLVFNATSYTIGLAEFDGTTITPTNESITLNKDIYTENPVYLTKTFDINGQKIGYIMYNAFVRDFDQELNAAFAQLQAENVTELVLDLRYNGGGSVETAIDLSSMITGQFNGDLFFTEEWNSDRQAEYAMNAVFDNTISNGDAINSLNLTQVYVLTTRRSASASEGVMNGLDPYISVRQIGQNTAGKFQASFLLYDAPAPNFSRNQANPGHTYAMLPLVFKTANANGFTDFIDGLVPDVEQNEDFSNLGILGDVNEPLLATALSEITGIPRPQLKTVAPALEIGESTQDSPIYQLMIAN